MRHIAHRASDDIPQSEEIRTLIKDIWEVREKKIQSGLASLDQHYLQVFTSLVSYKDIVLKPCTRWTPLVSWKSIRFAQSFQEA